MATKPPIRLPYSCNNRSICIILSHSIAVVCRYMMVLATESSEDVRKQPYPNWSLHQKRIAHLASSSDPPTIESWQEMMTSANFCVHRNVWQWWPKKNGTFRDMLDHVGLCWIMLDYVGFIWIDTLIHEASSPTTSWKHQNTVAQPPFFQCWVPWLHRCAVCLSVRSHLEPQQGQMALQPLIKAQTWQWPQLEKQDVGGFQLVMGLVAHSWMVLPFRENPKLKWMMTIDFHILGHPPYGGCLKS